MAGYLTDNVADYKLTGTNAFDVTSACFPTVARR